MPNMELPILYALTHPERIADAGSTPFDPIGVGVLTFEPIRRDAFPAFRVGVEAGRRGGTAPAVFNAANEVAVRAFLGGAIRFGEIGEVVEQVLADHKTAAADDLEAVLAADQWARVRGESLCSR
jgi:1-deoxy-D-xylulose-5-phosphate reductoisomerase